MALIFRSERVKRIFRPGKTPRILTHCRFVFGSNLYGTTTDFSRARSAYIQTDSPEGNTEAASEYVSSLRHEGRQRRVYDGRCIRRQIFDAIIVLTSFALDVVFVEGVTHTQGEEAIALLIIFLLWRILRVVNGQTPTYPLLFLAASL